VVVPVAVDELLEPDAHNFTAFPAVLAAVAIDALARVVYWSTPGISAGRPRIRSSRSLANRSLANHKGVDVRRFLTIAVAVGALSAVSVSPTFAAGKNPPSSCGVGGAVSVATQELGGLGKASHEAGLNPGEAIKEFHEFVKETC
jgi:hypothetical protein